MAAIGTLNELEVVKTVDFGVYLDGGSHDEILLPKRYVPENCQVGDRLEVFIYLDSEDRLVATTEKPLVMVGEFALLKVVEITSFGAFLDWGLMKDLLVPFREQQEKMEKGKSYLVYVYLDNESQRIVATSRLDKCLGNIPVDYEAGEEVDLIIAGKTDLGYKAIVDNSHWGVIYHNEVFQPLRPGEKLKGFIKQVRPDEKIDLRLDKPGYEKIDSISQGILDQMKAAGGFLPFSDKSDPELIVKTFKTSKKNFKKALGSLYKQHLITIEENGIRLV
ncbi:MAG: S1-like domain-containing RNA-binding protein [Prolixibacteraceae bacterium]